jgi:hypothetical protein
MCFSWACAGHRDPCWVKAIWLLAAEDVPAMGQVTKAEGHFLHRIVHRLFPGRPPEDLESRESRTYRCAFVRDLVPLRRAAQLGCTLQDTWYSRSSHTRAKLQYPSPSFGVPIVGIPPPPQLRGLYLSNPRFRFRRAKALLSPPITSPRLSVPHRFTGVFLCIQTHGKLQPSRVPDT